MPIKKSADSWADENTWPPSQFAKRARAHLKGKKIKAVLDLGCGSGRDSLYFSRAGYTVTAADIKITKFQENRLKDRGIKFIKDDLRHLILRPKSFDIVFAHLSLHYFDDRTIDYIIGKIYNCLKPGGYFFIKVKSTADPLFGKGKKLEENYYESDLKRHFFTSEYMKEKLAKFKIIKIQKTRSFTRPGKAAFIEAIAAKK